VSVEFDTVRASVAASSPGRAMQRLSDTFAEAWRTSSLVAAMRRMVAARAMSSAERGRIAAVAVAVAAGLQPLLASLMPATVKPSVLPIVMLAIAVPAMIVAWRADQVAAAWPSSRLARLLR
jgi:hypothetical protein